ncbi:aminotransferase class V-fold PLP-dependent enzyme, partial [Fulvivirga sp. RKSG066]|uniref:aminotransferase class V-fold PLP-dependent enzyme n=1 Tax=Fulvivirga aurantia TaxID=2529383 RepID=UPI0012BB6610
FTVEGHLKQALKDNIPSISHRSKAFESIYSTAVSNLKSLLGLGDDHHVLFTSSATEIWERIGQNLISHESYHLVNGAFSSRFQQTIAQLGKNAMSTEVNEGAVVDIEKLLIPETTELISFTQNETSTGASQPLEDIYKIREAFKDQLIAVDMVSAAPAVTIDYNKIDTAYFSVQKCFGLPAGLGVWIINNKCIEKAESILNQGGSIGSYHSIPVMLEKAVKNQTPETPNVLNLYLLAKVTGDMLNKGLDQIIRETNYKSAVLYQAFEQASYLTPLVENPVHRSKTTPVAVSSVDSSKIIADFEKIGLILGAGYGKNKSKHIRIANFPTHSKEHIEMIADRLVEAKY